MAFGQPQAQQMPPFPQAAPAQPQNPGPYTPPGPQGLVFDTFSTVNTQASRVAIEEGQAAWISGFMPIGKSNARTMPGVGVKVYENLTVRTVDFNFANIGSTPIMIVFLANGSIQQVNTSTLVVTQIAAAGTITNPAINGIDLTQWGSQYVLIVAQQTDGYFVWDGTVLYRAGGIGPVVTVTAGGSGYTGGATVAFSGGSGSGITGTVTVVGGIVTGVIITNSGTGYAAGETVAAAISPVSGGSGATATVVLMPFGVSGNAIETFTSRVWIADKATITFSAPASFTDFSTASGGGEFTSTDSFLRVGFSALRQSNGFLYLIGDSSINYISGVQTGGSPTTTTFTNQNADPEVGTPFGSTVDTLGSSIIFANAWGVHVGYGGKTAKRSSMMDGVYNSVPGFNGQALSACKAIVFGTRIWCVLMPIIDPISGEQTNELLTWNGENSWWSTKQDVSLQFVQHQEIDSVLTAYGSTGSAIFKLFQNPSVNFQKIIQSKLWDKPSQTLQKGVNRLWGLLNYFSIDAPDLEISVDNENSASSATVQAGPQEAVWVNDNNQAVTWVNNVGSEVTWFSGGLGVTVIGPLKVTQQGRLIGLTASTFAADMSISSLMVDNQVTGYEG